MCIDPCVLVASLSLTMIILGAEAERPRPCECPILSSLAGLYRVEPGRAESFPAPAGQPELNPPVRPASAEQLQWARCPDDERLHLMPPSTPPSLLPGATPKQCAGAGYTPGDPVLPSTSTVSSRAR